MTDQELYQKVLRMLQSDSGIRQAVEGIIWRYVTSGHGQYVLKSQLLGGGQHGTGSFDSHGTSQEKPG